MKSGEICAKFFHSLNSSVNDLVSFDHVLIDSYFNFHVMGISIRFSHGSLVMSTTNR